MAPPSTDRIESLDVLRGLALLGILVINIQSFSMPQAAYQNPTAYADLEGINLGVWLVSHVLADMKFLALFSMMFGASTVMLADRYLTTGRGSASSHYRRMIVLLGMGLAHAYLLWYGDILAVYAVCGMLLYPLRRLPVVWLLVLSLVMLAVPVLILSWSASQVTSWSEAEYQAVFGTWLPTEEMLALEVGAYQGPWRAQNLFRIPAALEFQTGSFIGWMLWRAGGMMLAGMALYRLGVLTATRSTRFYAALIAAGFLVGIPLVTRGALENLASDFSLEYVMSTGYLYNYVGSLFMCLGYVGVVMLVCRHQVWAGIRRPLAAVGRTALTNYLLQSLLCTTLFYGHGFGLFGQVQRIEQLAIVFGVWVFEILFSLLWLRHYRMGPVEWLWRSLASLRIQPLRIDRASAG